MISFCFKIIRLKLIRGICAKKITGLDNRKCIIEKIEIFRDFWSVDYVIWKQMIILDKEMHSISYHQLDAHIVRHLWSMRHLVYEIKLLNNHRKHSIKFSTHIHLSKLVYRFGLSQVGDRTYKQQ